MAEAFQKVRKSEEYLYVTTKLNSLNTQTTPHILDGSKQSLEEALKPLDMFRSRSGLRLNCSKSEALWIGSRAKCDLKLCPEKNFKWPSEKVKALGVWFAIDPNETVIPKLQRQIGKSKEDIRLLEISETQSIGKNYGFKKSCDITISIYSCPSPNGWRKRR